MSVSDGQLANQTTFNSSFMSRETDTDTVGKVDVKNVASESGANVINIQRFMNAVASALGMTTAEVYNFFFNYSSDVVGASNDTVLARLNALTLKFRGGLGLAHAHTGVDGQGEKISATNLLDINQLRASWQSFLKAGVTGSSVVVTTEFSGKTPTGTDTTSGVIVTPPNNKIAIYNSSTGAQFEDAEGQKVFGRLTEAATVWTLSFYTNEAGVETAYSFGSSSDLQCFFLEVFNLANSPTIPSTPEFGSLDITGDVVDATTAIRGVVNILAQSFAGLKTFTDGVKIDDILRLSQTDDSTTTGADQTITPTNTFWSLTNASLTSIAGITNDTASKVQYVQNKTGNTISLKHDTVATAADRILTPTSVDMDWKNNQVFVFIYNTTASRWALAGDSGGSLFSLAAIGAVPNANGASYVPATGVFNLQPANTSFGGVVTIADQSFSGLKTFADGARVEDELSLFMSNNGGTGSLADVSTNNPVQRFTNGSLVSIAGATPPSLECKFQIWINNTGNQISIVNEEATITAARRILTGTGQNIDVANNASLLSIYNTNASRWQVVGGSGGGSLRTAQTKTANYTILISDSVILANPTSGDITLTLPTASTATGKTFTVKRTHATANALKVSSAQNIDGATDNFIDNQYDFVNYYCDGSTYWTL